ncbi:MAG: tetratricopeptide repeat protein [Acidobacteriota bacterium]
MPTTRTLRPEALREARLREELPQVEAAAALGISARHYRRIELGQRQPSPRLLEKLASWAWDTLDLPESELLEVPPRLPARGLPRPHSSFVGRSAELEEIRRKLRAGARLLTLLGPPGVGKTRLALECAASIEVEELDRAWFCDLTEAQSLEELLHAMAVTLNVPLTGDPVEQLGHALASHGRILVVLDNCEQVVEQVREAVSAWLTVAKDTQFLATSRQLLHAAGEEVLPVEPLPSEAAVELFEQRAHSVTGSFSLSESNRAKAHQLVELLDGLPLAIELIAARMRVLSPAQALEKMRSRFDLVSPASSAIGPRSALRTSLDWSWELLTLWEQQTLAQLSVFEGGFTLEAAESLLELEPEAPWPLDIIQAIVDQSLVQVAAQEPEPGTSKPDRKRFDLLLSVRAYAADKLRSSRPPDAEQAAFLRHGNYYLSFVQDRTTIIHASPNLRPKHVEFTSELRNILAAYRRAIARNDAEIALSMKSALTSVASTFGPYSLAQDTNEQLSSMKLSTKESARAAILLCTQNELLGNTEPAAEQAKFALKMGTERQQAAALLQLAKMGAKQRGSETALTYARRSLALYRRSGDEIGVIHALRIVSRELIMTGHHAESSALLEEGLAMALKLGSLEEKASQLVVIGSFQFERGLLTEAHASFDEAARLAQQTSNRRMEAAALFNRSLVYREQGQSSKSHRLLHSSLATYRALGDRPAEGILLGQLALIKEDSGELAAALAHLYDSLNVLREVGDRRQESCTMANIGDILLQLGKTTKALSYLEEALTIHRELGDQRSEGHTLGLLGQALWHEGREEDARATFAKANALLRAVRDPLELGKLLATQARFVATTGQPEPAGELLSEAEGAAAQVEAEPGSELLDKIEQARQELAQRRGHAG